MDFKFNPEDFFLPFDALYWEAVCTVKVDYEIPTQDVIKQIVEMLVCIGILKPGMHFKTAKAGDLVIVSKGVHYITVAPGVN